MALEIAHRGYIIENGQFVLTGTNEELKNEERVKQSYIGI